MQHDHHAHHAYLCSGKPWPASGGSWIGHVLPGAFLCVWGMHWFISATFQHLAGARQQSAKLAHHRLGKFVPAGLLQDMEALLKVLLPVVAIILEFKLSGTKCLRCPSTSAKAGELDVSHMNSWSHATNYPPIILSGIVDLTHIYLVPLPQGIPHFFMAMSFAISAFLMLAHTKADPLDALVHQLLGWCMVAAAAAVMAQGSVHNQAYGLDAAKSLAVIMQGCWFFAITHIMFSQDPTWRTSQPGDMTPAMFTPVLFTWILIGVTAVLLLLYVAMYLVLSKWQQHNFNSTAESTSNQCNKVIQHSRHCSSSSWDWKGRKLSEYVKLEFTDPIDPAGAVADTRADQGGSDTSVEMV